MTADDFSEALAEALARPVGEAEDAGLDPQEILAEIEDMAAQGAIASGTGCSSRRLSTSRTA
jgi:hypothetical protein